jgi:hypothetical protein
MTGTDVAPPSVTDSVGLRARLDYDVCCELMVNESGMNIVADSTGNPLLVMKQYPVHGTEYV